MDGQSIDTLYLDIVVRNKNTTKALNTITKNLDKLSESVSTFDSKGLYKKFDSLFRILNGANVSGFANLSKNLSDIGNSFLKITNASKIDTRALYAKFNSLTRIITPFVDKIKEGETSLLSLASTLKSVKSSTSTGGGNTSNGGSRRKEGEWTEQVYNVNKLGKSYLSQSVSIKKFNGETTKTIKNLDEQGNELKKITTQIDTYGNKVKSIEVFGEKTPSKTWSAVGLFTKLGNWNYLLNMTRYYGRNLANIVQYAMDYVETQNLWQVANRENIAMAADFVSKMNKAFAISEETLMNYQAIFKNMISALGDLEDATASRLSQQLTQMALDFSSLYNVTIQDAMVKFQSVLSGEVLPIRTVSGYDITETTIVDLYKRMGGDKSMRQLNQLEKRLLRISAVFDQMGKTGAIGEQQGDLAKTIESASNQSRIMAEQFKEVFTWTGMIMLQGINSIGILKTINALLMTIKEVMKSLAISMGATTNDWSMQAVAGFEEVNDKIDEVQGKLLSFDKFSALNGRSSGVGSIFSVDPVIMDMIDQIQFGMGNANMEASKMAAHWLDMIGLGKEMKLIIDQNGNEVRMTAEEYEKLSDEVKATFKSVQDYREMSKELQYILSLIKNISISMVLAFGATALKRIFVFTTGIKSLGAAFKAMLPVAVIAAMLQMIESFKQGDIWGGILAGTIGVLLVGAMLKLHGVTMVKVLASFRLVGTYITATLIPAIKKFIVVISSTMIAGLKMAINWLNSLKLSTLGVAGMFAILSANVLNLALNWEQMSSIERIVGILGAVAAAATIAAIAIGGLQSAWTLGLGAAAIAAGILSITMAVKRSSSEALSAANQMRVPQFATGGFPEDGLFFANSGELVGGFSNGKTAVANNEQITKGIAMAVEPAVYRAVKSAMASGGSGDIVLNLDGKELARANVSNNARALSSNYRIELQPR